MQTSGSDYEGKEQKAVSGYTPPMPVIEKSHRFPVVYDEESNFGIVFYCRPDWRGGPHFAVFQRTRWRVYNIISRRYPPTEEGWMKAWHFFAAIKPEGAERVARLAGFEQRILAFLAEVIFLGGYMPGADLIAQSSYDLIFAMDRIGIFHPCGIQAVGELSYSDFTDVQVTGPGLVKSVNALVRPAKKIASAAVHAAQPGVNAGLLAAEDGAISAALNAVGTRTKTQTVLFMRAADSELFFLCPETKPDELRIALSRALGRIREILTSATSVRQSSLDVGNSSVISELDKAAALLDRGLITREEFYQLKAKLITGP